MKSSKLTRALQYLALLLVAVIYLLPLYWLFLGVFKTNSQHHAAPPIFFEFAPEVALSNLRFAIYNAPVPGGRVLFNSFSVAVSSAVLAIAFGSLAAYSFARFNTGGRKLPFFILSLRMIPPIAIGLPFFLIFRLFGLLDSRLGLVIAYVSLDLPFVIWILRSFFREMSPEIEDAARIDGASDFQVLRYVTMPLARPALATAWLLVFINAWNEFFFAILLTRTNARTLPSLIPLFLPRELAPTQPIGSAFAIAIVGAIPVIIIAFILQRYLVYGLSFGAIKE